MVWVVYVPDGLGSWVVLFFLQIEVDEVETDWVKLFITFSSV